MLERKVEEWISCGRKEIEGGFPLVRKKLKREFLLERKLGRFF